VRQWLEGEWRRLGGGALIFLPLTMLFRAGVALRRLAYRAKVLPSWRARVPVVVVGNITVGGTGKTPLVIALVEMLRRKGWSPGVVARGYGRVPRREQDPLGVVRVYPELATPEHFGDEPVLIARRASVPVFVSPDRAAAARALLEVHPEVDILVSDDGLQHYGLARDVEIAVVDGDRLYGNGLMLPSGPLREPISRLATVDAVVMNLPGEGIVADRGPGAAPSGTGSKPPMRFAMRLANERFAAVGGSDEREPQDFALAVRGRVVAAVAGIGNPARFFEHLERLGVRARRHAFADHYLYQPADLKLPGVEVIVMTEKDAVKCAAFADSRMWFLRVDAVLPPDFEEFVLARLARSTANGPQAA
jgi:tetraacyldisaccharide 4'-kinase